MVSQRAMACVAIVSCGMLLHPAVGARDEDDTDKRLAVQADSSIDKGDALSAAFQQENVMFEAVQRNMMTVTGARHKSGGEPQEISYRFESSSKYSGWKGYNSDLNTQVYFCKSACPDPDKSKNLPGLSLSHVEAQGSDKSNFKLAGLSSAGLDVSLSMDMSRVKRNGQPILKGVSTTFTMYNDSVIPASSSCYLILLHSHKIDYRLKGSFPTEAQILGTTDLDWFETGGTSPPAQESLCGVCVKITWSHSMMGGATPTPTSGPCVSQRQGEEYYSRTV